MMTNGNGKWPLPEGWVWTTLGRVRKDSGNSLNPSKHPDQIFELYSVPCYETLQPEFTLGSAIGSSKRTVSEDTVLLCKINPRINRVWVVGSFSEYPKIASTEWILFEKVDGIVPKYLRYYMMRDVFRDYLAHNASGVGGSLMRVRPATLEDYPIPLAPLPTQHQIVAEIEKQFTRLDAAVAALRRARANLARYKAAVLKAAVEGRLVAQDAADEPASKLLARILAERRAHWEAAHPGKKYIEPKRPDVDDLPELPEGWVWATVEEVAEHRLGKMLDKGKNRGSLQPYLRNANVRWFYFDLSDLLEMRVTEDELDNISIKAGDLVVCEGGEPGRSAVWELGRSAVIQKALHRVRPFTGVLPWYLAYCLSSDATTGHLETYFTGSTIKHFTGEALRSYVFPLPPSDEQERIVTELDRHLSIIQSTEQALDANLARAERLRQAVLRKAFRGEL